MSGGGPSKAPMRREQQELARERIRSERKARKARRHSQVELPLGITPATAEMRTQRFVIKTGATKPQAFVALKKASTLTTYFRRYLYDENIQRAVMQGEFTIEGPTPVINAIIVELSATWSMGRATA